MESLPPGALRAGPARGLPDRRPPSPSQRGGHTASQSGPSRGLRPGTCCPAASTPPAPSCPSPAPRPGPGKVDSPARRPFRGPHPSPVALGGQGGPVARAQAAHLGSALQDPGGRGEGTGWGACAAPSQVPGWAWNHRGRHVHSGHDTQRVPAPTGQPQAPSAARGRQCPRVWAQEERRGNGAAPGVYPGRPGVDKKH